MIIFNYISRSACITLFTAYKCYLVIPTASQVPDDKPAVEKSRGKIHYPDWMGFSCHLGFLCCNIWNPRSKCSRDSLPCIKGGFSDCPPHMWCQNIAFIVVVKVLKFSGPKKDEVGDEVGPNKMHEFIWEWNGKRKGAQGTEQGQTLDAILGCKLFRCCIGQGRPVLYTPPPPIR